MEQKTPALFTPETTAWLHGITDNNTKEFFAAHKEQYLHDVREPFEALLAQLAEEFGGIPHVFRPNRDVRFSADKSPYKMNISGSLQDRPGTGSAAYLELSLQGLFAATGYYQMAPDQLERYRKALVGPHCSDVGVQLRQALETATQAGCEVSGEQLKTAPKGIDKEAENIDLLRYKSLAIVRRLPLAGSLETQDALLFVRSTWDAGRTTGEWLDQHVGASVLAERQR